MKLSTRMRNDMPDIMWSVSRTRATIRKWAGEVGELEAERNCLLLAIKHYDLADMLDKDVAEILDMCARGIVPPYAREALLTGKQFTGGTTPTYFSEQEKDDETE